MKFRKFKQSMSHLDVELSPPGFLAVFMPKEKYVPIYICGSVKDIKNVLTQCRSRYPRYMNNDITRYFQQLDTLRETEAIMRHTNIETKKSCQRKLNWSRFELYELAFKNDFKKFDHKTKTLLCTLKED